MPTRSTRSSNWPRGLRLAATGSISSTTTPPQAPCDPGSGARSPRVPGAGSGWNSRPGSTDDGHAGPAPPPSRISAPPGAGCQSGRRVGTAGPCGPTSPLTGRSVTRIDVEMRRLGAEPDLPMEDAPIGGGSPPDRLGGPTMRVPAQRSQRRPYDPPDRFASSVPGRVRASIVTGLGALARVIRRRSGRDAMRTPHDVDPVPQPGRWITPPLGVALEM